MAIATGAKRPVSKMNPHLSQLAEVELMIAHGEVYERLASVRIKTGYRRISGNLTAMAVASYFLEVADVLIRFNYPDQEVFELLKSFLSELDGAKSNEEYLLILNRHLFELLKVLGYEPSISAKNQRQLLRDLNRLAGETAERKINSFDFLERLIFS